MLCAAAFIIAPLRAMAAEDAGKKAADAVPAAAAAEKKDDVAPAKLETDDDKFSYMMGADVGTYLTQNGVPVVRERFLMGFNDITQGKDPAMTDEETRGIIEQFEKLAGPPPQSPDGKPVPVKPVTGDEKFLGQLSYVLGASVGTKMKRNGIAIKEGPFIRAIEDVANERKMALTDDEMKLVFEAYGKKQVEKRKASADKNLVDGKAFLDDNAKKPGVKTTASGLQYTVVTEGKGEMPKATDTVKTHYRGTLLDGTEFDSSYSRNEPTEFPVNKVIAGWTEALQLMRVGDKWKLFIPSELAYGERGAGREIGPNSALIFDIELLEIVKAKEEASDGTIKLDAGTAGKKTN
jgi:FKBP-type peptidyl-prolyl cis-trans isomerase FklB